MFSTLTNTIGRIGHLKKYILNSNDLLLSVGFKNTVRKASGRSERGGTGREDPEEYGAEKARKSIKNQIHPSEC